jgi:hypothetical protein
MATSTKKPTIQQAILQTLKSRRVWHQSDALVRVARSATYDSWLTRQDVSSAISRLRKKGETIESRRDGGDKWSYRWVPPHKYTPAEISEIKKELRKMMKFSS